MKVIGFALSYVHARRIGAELALHHLLAHLAGQGHDVQVVTTTAVPRATIDGVHVIPANARRPQGDVIVVNAGLAGKARQWWPHTPLVIWAHNNQVPTILDVRAGMAKGNAALVTNTDHMRDVYRSVLQLDSTVLHPPINPGPVTDAGDSVALINLTPDKGSDVFWDLAATNPHLPFLGVRGGYGTQDVRALDNVSVVDHGDLADVWARTRILLVPSRHESYSMVAAEAATRGIPVIAADLPGIREAAGHGGTYVINTWQAALDTTLARWDEKHTNALVHAASTQAANELTAVTALIEQFRVTERAA